MSHHETGASADNAADRDGPADRVGRRRFVRAAGAAGVIGFSGRVGFGGGGGDGSGSGGVGTVGDSGGGDMELSYRTLFVGGDGEVMADIIDRFTEEPPLGDGITINRQRAPWDEYYNQLFTAMTGGNAPDLAVSHTTYLRWFRDTLTDISDYVSSDDYVSVLDACILDGSQYAVPMDSHPVGLSYNMDILDEAGVEPPFAGFSEFEGACNAIRDDTDALPFGPSPVNGTGERQWFTSLAQLGGSVFNEDRSEAVFDEGAGLEATEYHASISDDRGWDRLDTSENRVTQSFENGSIAVIMNGTWAVNTMRDVDFNWG